jgi:hypothetical protein
MLTPEIAKLPAHVRDDALSVLEGIAGREPTMITPPGAPPSLAKPVTRVHRVPPDTLFDEAIGELRLKRQKADAAEGQEKVNLYKEYEAEKKKMESVLSGVNPVLAERYKDMNRQYAADMDVRDFLWRMHKNKAWTTDANGTHIDVEQFAKDFQSGYQMFDERGMFGGGEDALRSLAGSSRAPGARPTVHEAYARMFQQFPLAPISGSLGINPQLLTQPRPPVPSAAVRGVSDILGQAAIRPMVGE